MNLVEVWFGIVERQAIRRGVLKSGPRPPNKSSRKPTDQQLRVRATSVLAPASQPEAAAKARRLCDKRSADAERRPAGDTGNWPTAPEGEHAGHPHRNRVRDTREPGDPDHDREVDDT
jgi:hypothetical protein